MDMRDAVPVSDDGDIPRLPFPACDVGRCRRLRRERQRNGEEQGEACGGADRRHHGGLRCVVRSQLIDQLCRKISPGVLMCDQSIGEQSIEPRVSYPTLLRTATRSWCRHRSIRTTAAGQNKPLLLAFRGVMVLG
jgi:hypothetical protein